MPVTLQVINRDDVLNVGRIKINDNLALIADALPEAGDFAATDHNHDADYAPLVHNHDGTYSLVSHNHAGIYALVGHNHDGTYVLTSAVGSANGVAPLDATAKIASSLLPPSSTTQAGVIALATQAEVNGETVGNKSVTPETLAQYVADQLSGVSSGLTYQGAWDATSGVPSATPESGQYWIVSVAGTTNLDGETDWQIGDWAVYNGVEWQKIDQTFEISPHTHAWSDITSGIPDPILTLAGDASGSATFTDLGNATLTVVVADDSHNHVISNVDGLQTSLDGKVDENTAITGATNTKITYDAKGLVTGGTSLATTDIPNLAASKITTGTFVDARIAQSNVTQHQAALSITESQISNLGNYLVSADINTLAELNAIVGDATLVDASHTHTESDITDLGTYLSAGDDAGTLGSGAATDGQVLTADGAGNAAWETASGGGTATSTTFDPSSTTLSSINVQDAIEEIPEWIDAVSGGVGFVAASGPTTLDLDLGRAFLLTLTGDVAVTFNNIPSGNTNSTSWLMALQQDATGNHATTISNSVTWMYGQSIDDLNLEPNAVNLLSFIQVGGVTYVSIIRTGVTVLEPYVMSFGGNGTQYMVITQTETLDLDGATHVEFDGSPATGVLSFVKGSGGTTTGVSGSAVIFSAGDVLNVGISGSTNPETVSIPRRIS